MGEPHGDSEEPTRRQGPPPRGPGASRFPTWLRLPPHLTQTFTYLSTVVTTQAVSFLLLPVITRFLGPEEYGSYAVALAFANLLAMFGTSWMRHVAFRFYYDAVATRATRSFYGTLVLIQAATIATLFAAATLYSALTPDPLVPASTLLAAAVMMLAGDVHVITVGLLRAEQRTGSFALAELTAVGTRLAGTLFGLLAGARSPEFLFLAAAGAAVVGATISVTALRRSLTGPAGFNANLVRNLVRYALSAMPFSVGEWLNTLADRLILDYFTARAIVGVYSAGHGIGDRIVGSLAMAVFMMAWPDVLRSYFNGGVDHARVAVRRYISLFLWMTVGPLVALVLHAETVIQLLGPDYQPAVDIIPIVAMAAWVRGFGNCFNRHLELQKRFWAMSAMTLAGAGVNVTLNLILVPHFEAIGAAVATLTSQTVVMLGFFLTRDRALVDFPFRDAGLVLAVVIVAGAATQVLLGTGLVSLAAFAIAYAGVMAVALLGPGGRSDTSSSSDA